MRYTLLALVEVITAACNQKPAYTYKYPYSIADFPDSIRPYLLAIVNEGYMGEKTYPARHSIGLKISDADVMKLTRCEHPLLRSVALNIIKYRDHLDHYNILMNHLDDTARVSWYYQCAIFPNVMVSDYLVWNFEWKTEQAKTKTIDEIIRHHYYLDCAYQAIEKTTMKEAYYPMVKIMAERDVDMSIRSKALYKLAEFRKPEDVAFLHEVLMRKRSYLDCNCFAIMSQYPDKEYLAVLQQYYKSFYKLICRKESDYAVTALCYFSALASYKSKESADILEKIFYRRPFLPCYPIDSNYVKGNLYKVLANYPSSVYGKMATISKAYVEKLEKPSPPLAPDFIPDSGYAGPIGW